MKIEQRPWKPQDLLDDLQSIIDEEPDSYMNSRRVTLCQARDYLEEYFSSLPNNPLTLKELREMDGEPVWVYNCYNGWCNCRVVECITPEDVFFTDSTARRISAYGDGWLAYRRKPEEGTAGE